MENNIVKKANKSTFYGIGILIVLLALLIGPQLWSTTPNISKTKPSTPVLIAGTSEKMEYLSNKNSSFCGLQPSSVDSYSDSDRIQGACCGAMDLHRYQEQVEGLKKYSHISQIPSDPYDIPASLAKELFAYQRDISLNVEQQEIYNEAMELSHEGGPCCCKCWRWTAFEGQAKYLITKHDFNAQQIADIWDIEDGCGGTGHSHKT